MIIDNELLFADGTWAPTATGDNISTNVTDTGPLTGIGTSGPNTGRDLGQGEEVWFNVLVKTAVTSGGAATVDFRFRTDSAANLTTSPVDPVRLRKQLSSRVTPSACACLPRRTNATSVRTRTSEPPSSRLAPSM